MNFKKVIEWKFKSSENWEYTGTRDSNCIHEYGATATASNGKVPCRLRHCNCILHCNVYHLLVPA